MTVQMEKAPTTSSRDRAQQLYNKNTELESKRQKSLQSRIPSDPNAWFQIRENYEAIILEDHAFSEQHNIEFALWQLHYKRIEEFRAHFNAAQASGRSSATNSGRGPPQPERVMKIRMQFKAFLSEATGFYHDLILKIRSKYGLPLGHFSDGSENIALMGNDAAKSSDAKKGLVSCHRCLIYLGDLARYKGLYGEGESRVREYSAASSYYLQAASLWPSNGNPHHQLAILATYSSDDLVAVYRYFRSLAAEIPFSTAKDNLVIAFEKNRQSYTQLLEKTKKLGDREVSMKEKYKEFCIQFVRLNGILFSRTSLETFTAVLSSVNGALHELLSSGPKEEQNFGTDSAENGLSILRLIAVLIFTVHNVNRKKEGQTYAEILQQTALLDNACTVTFELMTLVVERCLQLHDPSSSFLLPGILIFLEWLACCPDVANKPISSKSSFWKHSIALFNKLLSDGLVSVDDDDDETCFTNMSRYEEGETESRLALSEDFELRGFLPLLPAHSILDFSRKHSTGVGGSSKEKRIRIKRIIAAGKALASAAMVDHKAVVFDSKAKQFVIGFQPQVSSNSLSNESPSSEQKQENAQGEDDDDEEIVFRPAFVEKQMDTIGLSFLPPQKTEQGKSAPLIMPSDNIAPQHPPVDLRNSTWLVEQQASLPDGFKKLRFAENGHETKRRVSFQDGGPLLPPQPSVSFMDNAIFSDYRRAPEPMIPYKVDFLGFSEPLIPSKVDSLGFSEAVIPSKVDSLGFSEGGFSDNLVLKPQTSSPASKSQTGRPIRHLGPPPGFSPVPPRNVSMPMHSLVGTNGSMVVDDYSWLDGYHSVGPLGNTQFVSNSSSSNGMPFPGMQASAPPQFQGGNFKPFPDHQSFRNVNVSYGHHLPEQQQHAMTRQQFASQSDHYPGQPNWPGPYRV